MRLWKLSLLISYLAMFIVAASPGPRAENLNHLWTKSFGDLSHQVGYSIAFDRSGNAIVAGKVQGGVDFGGGPLTSAGDADILISKFGATKTTPFQKNR